VSLRLERPRQGPNRTMRSVAVGAGTIATRKKSTGSIIVFGAGMGARNLPMARAKRSASTTAA